MDVSGLIPVPDSIPVPWGWLELLLVLTFVLHLLLMNLMLGGSLLALAGRLRGTPIPAETRSLPVLIALTINLGVPPLLFTQTLFGHFLYSSSVLMAVFWLSIVPILIVAYYAAYGFVGRHARAGAGTVWLCVSALLLLAVGFMLSNNMTLMLRPERWGVYFARPDGTFLNLSEPTLFPRFLHFVTASIAVASLGWAVYHAVRARRAGTEPGGEVRSGLRLFAYATMAQVLVGVLFWITLPGRIGALFLGGSAWHSAHIALGILLALTVIGLALRGRLRPTVWLTLLLVVDMVLVRDLVRSAYLAPHFSPADLPVVLQSGPMIWFFVAFAAVGAVMVYVLRVAWRAKA